MQNAIPTAPETALDEFHRRCLEIADRTNSIADALRKRNDRMFGSEPESDGEPGVDGVATGSCQLRAIGNRLSDINRALDRLVVESDRQTALS